MTNNINTLEAAFPAFAKMRPLSGFEAQNADSPGGGKDPRLAALDRTMAMAGLDTGEGLSVQGFWDDAWDWGKKAVETGKKAYEIGKGLGLFSDGPDAQIEAQFLDTFLRTQVEDLIKKLHEYVNRYGGLIECVPLVTRCVEQFGAGQYAAALATGYQAYNCISSKI
ncbi:hypothetical protein WHI96_26300 [Pseudonocardia tropica]|uniref:ESX-1 secretion-associated protein EspA/EspE-like domain-containing protein n=1 Tax=Pseudonocardia tropica TaxID=681289 RepID=A0ABV1K2A8_9PSEU